MGNNREEQDFLDLYEAHADTVFRRCYFKTSNRDVALDLTQEAFMRVWNYLAKGQRVDNMKAFLYTVVNNLIKDWYKKKKAVALSRIEVIAEEIPDPSINIEQGAETAHVVRVMSRLDDGDRELITMRFIDGLSPRDIAEILSEKENTVSVRLHRAIHRLRELLHGER